MDGYKSILKSVTFWGVILSIVAKIFLFFGIEALNDQQYLTDLATFAATYAPLIVGFIADAITMYGRANATKAVVLAPPPVTPPDTK